MSNKNYSLEVISHHPTFKNKNLRKYYVDGIDTVGAWGDEPFEVVFKNHSWQKVQVKLTIDGTDVLTGKPGTTDPTKDMWVVNGYGTLALKAWPETNNGGAQLVFTSATNSVAVHTHGDLSSRGIIAAAVYVEGHVEPVKVSPPVVVHHHYPDYYYPYTFGGSGSFDCDTIITCSDSDKSYSDSYSSNSVRLNDSRSRGESMKSSKITKSIEKEKLVAVGAGQHVDQQITHVAGLVKPTFTETVRVKYMWWDDLVATLRENNVPAPHASGFPADQNKLNINLGRTPRIGKRVKNKMAAPIQTYLRV